MSKYEDFINSIKESRENKWFEYSERHHILPRCIGGTDGEDNLIYLTYREHFIAHKILAEENPENRRLGYAYWCMANMNNSRKIITPEEYEEARSLHVSRLKEYSLGEGNPNYGTKVMNNRQYQIHVMEEEINYYMSIGYALGALPKSEITKEKLRTSLIGHIVSSDTRKRLAEAQRNYIAENTHQRVGTTHSEDTKLRIGELASERYKGEGNPMYGRRGKDNPNYGKKRSDDTRRLLSISKLGNPSNTGKICINNGIRNKFILPGEYPEYEKLGYRRGRK